MTASIISSASHPAQFATALCILTAAFQLLFYWLNASKVILEVVSHSMLGSFATGAAVVTVLSQQKDLWGVKIPTEDMYKTIPDFFRQLSSNFSKTNYGSIIFGLTSILLLLIAKWATRRFKSFVKRRPRGTWLYRALSVLLFLLQCNQIIVVIISTAISSRVHRETRSNFAPRIIGDINSGLSSPSVSFVNEFFGESSELVRLFLGALAISIISFIEVFSVITAVNRSKFGQFHPMESIMPESSSGDELNDISMSSSSSSLDIQSSQDSTFTGNLDHPQPHQELLALSMIYIANGLFSGMPVSASFSRSAVLNESGARERLAHLFTASIIVITVYGFHAELEHLPRATLAAIIIVSAWNLVDFSALVTLGKSLRARSHELVDLVNRWYDAADDLSQRAVLDRLYHHQRRQCVDEAQQTLIWVLCFALSLWFGLLIGVSVTFGVMILLHAFDSFSDLHLILHIDSRSMPLLQVDSSATSTSTIQIEFSPLLVEVPWWLRALSWCTGRPIESRPVRTAIECFSVPCSLSTTHINRYLDAMYHLSPHIRVFVHYTPVSAVFDSIFDWCLRHPDSSIQLGCAVVDESLNCPPNCQLVSALSVEQLIEQRPVKIHFARDE